MLPSPRVVQCRSWRAASESSMDRKAPDPGRASAGRMERASPGRRRARGLDGAHVSSRADLRVPRQTVSWRSGLAVWLVLVTCHGSRGARPWLGPEMPLGASLSFRCRAEPAQHHAESPHHYACASRGDFHELRSGRDGVRLARTARGDGMPCSAELEFAPLCSLAGVLPGQELKQEETKADVAGADEPAPCCPRFKGGQAGRLRHGRGADEPAPCCPRFKAGKRDACATEGAADEPAPCCPRFKGGQAGRLRHGRGGG